jgi:hypothetical protein
LANFHKTEFSFLSRGLKGLMERRLGIDLFFEQQLLGEIRHLAATEANAALGKRLEFVAQHLDSNIARVDSSISHQSKSLAEQDRALRDDLEGVERRLNAATKTTDALRRPGQRPLQSGRGNDPQHG